MWKVVAATLIGVVVGYFTAALMFMAKGKTPVEDDEVHTCDNPAYCSYCRRHAGR